MNIYVRVSLYIELVQACKIFRKFVYCIIVHCICASFQKSYFPEFRELCVKFLGCLYRVQIVRKFVQFKFLGVNPHKFSLKSTTEVNKGKNRKMIKRKIFIWRSTRNQKMKAYSDCNSWNITRSFFLIWREIYQFSLIGGSSHQNKELLSRTLRRVVRKYDLK